MGVDEEGTLAALKACRHELKIAEHRGRIVKTTGDGALVEFASAVDAVRCARKIQRAMAERSAASPEDRRVEFRIGINVGDVIIDEGDIRVIARNSTFTYKGVAVRIEQVAKELGVRRGRPRLLLAPRVNARQPQDCGRLRSEADID